MKMNITPSFGILLTSLSLVTATATPALSKTVSLDPVQSKIHWVGKKVTGQHEGSVTLKAGQIEIDGKNVKGGQFEIDMTSIKNDDLKDAAYNTKLTNHLKSDDFFGVEKHPTSTFTITSVKPLKNRADATHEITGNLSIKGVTQPVTFPAKIDVSGGKAHAEGKVTIDRTKYNIRYGSGKFFENLGDKMINDTFELNLDLTSKT